MSNIARKRELIVAVRSLADRIIAMREAEVVCPSTDPKANDNVNRYCAMHSERAIECAKQLEAA